MRRSLPVASLALMLLACGTPPGGPDGGTAGDAGDTAPADGGSDASDAGTDGGPDCAEPLAEPGDSPWGWPLDGWSWDKRGVILEAEGAGAGEGLLLPALVTVDGVLHLFFAQKDGTAHRIHHATSTDGTTWTTPSAVTGLPDGSVVSYPSVLHEDGRFRMWFGSGGIDLAESADGDAWTPVAQSVLRPGAAGAFDSLTLSGATVLRAGEGYVMWYVGFDGQHPFAVGRATSPDGLAFTRDPETPVLTHGAADAYDNKNVIEPCVQAGPGGLLMWYGAYDVSQSNPGPYRVALATSADGIAWDKRGVSVPLGDDGSDAWSTRDPAVVPWGDGWLMVYVGMGTDSVYRLHVATSAVCAR